MPTLKGWAEGGVFAEVEAVLPTVTNANNASICCGSWPKDHGVVGNSFLDEDTGQEEYLEDAALVCAPTLFDAPARPACARLFSPAKRRRRRCLAVARKSFWLRKPPTATGRRFSAKRRRSTRARSITGCCALRSTCSRRGPRSA
ncbi:alkaline phosphatase family protein, partial [Methyloceanibacter marginalis]|uniref:alkaline phosphatase family protein n=1 Tax=Methyloceanibacter marginalis TaxID=1774971 RepID=UPI003CC7A443